jgi:hypothetical protein
MVTSKQRRIAEKQVIQEYGQHPLFEYRYANGSRRVRDFLQAIAEYTLAGELTEAAFWQEQLTKLVPQFTRERS